MSAIREACDALADAIEEALEAKGGKGKTVEQDEPAPKATKGKKVALTLAQVREKLVELSGEHGKEAVIDILSRFGVTKIGDLPEEHYAECAKLASEYEPEPEPEEDDPLGDDPDAGDDDPDPDAEVEPEPPKKRRRRN